MLLPSSLVPTLGHVSAVRSPRAGERDSSCVWPVAWDGSPVPPRRRDCLLRRYRRHHCVLGGVFISDGMGCVVPLRNFPPGSGTALGWRAAMGECVVEEHSGVYRVRGSRGGLCLFTCHCMEGLILQGREDSLCVAKGFWVTLFPCPPSPQPSLS